MFAIVVIDAMTTDYVVGATVHANDSVGDDMVCGGGV